MAFADTLHNEVECLADIYSVRRSNAFPIWFATVAWDLEEDEAYDALQVEGPNEKGMDLFWIDDQNRRILIAQCKFSSSATTRPKEKDLTNLLSCVDWLANPGALEREGRPELIAAAQEYVDAIQQDYTTQLWFVYSGPRDENVDKRIRIYNANRDHQENSRMAVHCDLDLLKSRHEELRGEGRRIERAVIGTASNVFEVSGTFGRGLVTSISGPELVKLHENFGDKLFARNVRGWLGARKGSVNAGIIATVEDDIERGYFWAYNNGITIVCDNYSYDSESEQIELSNFSIVNGCQTTVALARSGVDDLSKTFLLARIISPPETLVDSVILFTNSQNLVRTWERVSQDKIQRRLHQQFNALGQPVYYDIRRGDWKSLSPSAKRRFRLDNGPYNVIKHDRLAQYLSAYRGMAVVAYKHKAFLFDKYYEQTFPPDMRVEEALFVWKAGESVQDVIREEIRKETERINSGERERDKYLLMLKRGGRIYALGVFGLVGSLRNGPDYLRSITEERIVSKGAAERINKYAKVSVQLYMRATNDLLEISKTDLSVLVRETDFFKRLSERVVSEYEVMKINEDWLEGALPKLF